jgi:phenylacetate-CoA ligase
MNVEQIMTLAPVIPVLVVHDVEHARPIAEALVAGGLPALEVTLRTPCALDVIREMGRVVVTDLHNFATPMIRYDIGDFAEVGPACPCGRGLPTFRRVVGRERNLLRLADGRRHWPLLGGYHFRDVAPVRQFQAIQHSFERIEMRLVCDRELTGQEEDALCAMILKALGHDFTLELRYFRERLPLGPNGKFEEFVCRVETP